MSDPRPAAPAPIGDAAARPDMDDAAARPDVDDARIATQAEMLGNRLRKTMRHLGKWAKREHIECMRLYDVDIPEIPLAIDRYGEHAHVSLYVGPVPRSGAWMQAMAAVVADALGIARDHVHVKDRAPQRQSGDDQYQRLGDAGRRLVVHEGGLKFLVNLDDYVDTGLFLDHRPMRAMVRGEARDKDVLNLFAYTGAFSVHAAAGGARTTTTVDMSATYLEWAASKSMPS